MVFSEKTSVDCVLEEVKGIYFLIDDNFNVLYVGKSTNIYFRILTHQKQGKIPFTKFSIIGYPNADDFVLSKLETDFFLKYLPPFNKSFPYSSNYINIKQETKSSSFDKNKKYAYKNYRKVYEFNSNFYVKKSTKIM